MICLPIPLVIIAGILAALGVLDAYLTGKRHGFREAEDFLAGHCSPLILGVFDHE